MQVAWVVSISRWWFQIFLIFTPNLGEDSHFDQHIFQMGWNHQPDFHCFFFFGDGFLSLLKVVLLTERTTQCTAASTQYSGDVTNLSLLNHIGFEDFWGLPHNIWMKLVSYQSCQAGLRRRIMNQVGEIAFFNKMYHLPTSRNYWWTTKIPHEFL